MKTLLLLHMISGGGEHKGGLLDIDPGLIFWTIVTFVILLVLLRLTAWGPIIKMLEEREEKIKNSLEEAEKARREAAALTEKNQEIMAKAEREAQEVARRAKENAEKLKTEIMDQAKAEAARLVAEARTQIENEMNSAISTLRKEVGDMAVTAAGKILATNLDSDKHKKLIDDFIKDMPVGRN